MFLTKTAKALAALQSRLLEVSATVTAYDREIQLLKAQIRDYHQERKLLVDNVNCPKWKVYVGPQDILHGVFFFENVALKYVEYLDAIKVNARVEKIV